jgi:hypothetical protein
MSLEDNTPSKEILVVCGQLLDIYYSKKTLDNGTIIPPDS